MEILFMVFMVVVSIMALFAVTVVFIDIVKEMLSARKGRDSAVQPVYQPVQQPVCQPERTVAVSAAIPAASAVEDAPIATEPCEAEQASNGADGEAEDGTISFSKGQQQTLEEKYIALSSEQKSWYDEIIKYATSVEGSKRVKNLRYEEYKVGNSRLVRMLIKRGIIHCEFVLHNSDFKNYVNENKINVRQSATTMLIESAATVQAAKNSIDIVVAAITEEKEYKKELARQKRRAARQTKKESESEASEV